MEWEWILLKKIRRLTILSCPLWCRSFALKQVDKTLNRWSANTKLTPNICFMLIHMFYLAKSVRIERFGLIKIWLGMVIYSFYWTTHIKPSLNIKRL
jgi:hypothetical protein